MATNKPQANNQNKKGKSFMGEVLFKYMPYWPLFIIFVILSLFGAWFYLRTVTPLYETTASIMLKDENKGSADGQMITALDQLSEKKIVENEIEILQSRTLMNQVVLNLGLYASFFEEDKLLSRPAYVTSPVEVVSPEPDKIVPTPKIKFEFNERDSVVTIGSNKYPLNKLAKTQFGYLKFIPNKNYVARAQKPLYFSLTSPKAVAANLISRLKTNPSTKLTSVLTIRLTDADQNRGEDIVNELIAVYNKATIDEKNRLAASTATFITERLGVVEKDLLDIEKKAQSYKSSRGAVDIGTQGQLFLQNVSQNDQLLADVNMQLSALNEVEKNITSNEGASSISPSTLGLKDAQLPELLNKLSETELNYEKLRKTTGENNPILSSIKDQINKIKPSILANIKSQRANLEASKLNLHSTNNSYSSILQAIPQKERELIDIQRQQAIKSNLYSFLLQKKDENDLSHASTIPEARVVDKAQASFAPVSPNSNLFYAVALILGLALPATFVFIKEFLSRKVLFRHEIESLTSAPIIGEISFDKSKDPVVIQEGKRTFIAEQFRRMRSSLGYLGGDSGKKKILVTSSLSGEGKSFVALNLSLSLALTGKKIVLLELDLANPSLSKKLNVDYEQGVSSYLWGECEPEDIIKRTTLNNNLFFLPSGPLPENPSELIMSDKLKELLNYLEDVFDVIIIDSAPATLLSDAYVLSPLCDTTLYVVKHKFTPKIYLERLDEENNNSGNQLSNMRIVFNGIKSRGFTNNGYGYGYGYGYIHNNSGKKIKVKA